MKEDTNGEVRVTDPETGGQKGQKPARFDLIPPAIWEVAELYGKGAAKYTEYGECTCRAPVHEPGCPALVVTQTGDWNWRKGYAWSLSYAAAQRHLNQFWAGEDYDEETGCHHLASVVFHALALMTFALEHPEKDDRYGTTQLGVDEGAADLKERIKVVDDARSVRDDLPYTYESPFRPPEALLSNVGRDQGGSEGHWQRAWADHFERSSRG